MKWSRSTAFPIAIAASPVVAKRIDQNKISDC